ncbi:MAG: glycosyltransferase [Candidatus Marsarchaeota archaeon]|nr:glycosyltransferase [Candidatus Marsarchaeota archaeon]
MPRVSVIVPAYNCQGFIAETVESIFGQTYSDYEIIVVNDGSSDRTEDILKGYGDRIRYVYQDNGGVSAARNRGLAMAKGELIAFLDHDDLWLPEKLERQVHALESRPEVSLVYSDCYIVDEGGSITGKYSDHVKPFRGTVFRELFICNFIPFLTVLARKTALDSVGDFKVGWGIAEDYDILLRMARAYPVEYLSLSLAKYRKHSGNFSRNVDRFLEENLMLVENFLRDCPELRSTRGRKLGALRYDAAYQYLALGELSKARGQFLKAVKANPASPKALSYCALSLLGLNVIDVLRSAKRSVVRRRERPPVEGTFGRMKSRGCKPES